MLKLESKRKKTEFASAEIPGGRFESPYVVFTDVKIICRIHSDVRGVDAVTLAFHPNVHAYAGGVPGIMVIPEDSFVEVLNGPMSLTVTENEVQNFWEVAYIAESGVRYEVWVPESFLIFSKGCDWN